MAEFDYKDIPIELCNGLALFDFYCECDGDRKKVIISKE